MSGPTAVRWLPTQAARGRRHAGGSGLGFGDAAPIPLNSAQAAAASKAARRGGQHACEHPALLLLRTCDACPWPGAAAMPAHPAPSPSTKSSVASAADRGLAACFRVRWAPAVGHGLRLRCSRKAAPVAAAAGAPKPAATRETGMGFAAASGADAYAAQYDEAPRGLVAHPGTAHVRRRRSRAAVTYAHGPLCLLPARQWHCMPLPAADT